MKFMTRALMHWSIWVPLILLIPGIELVAIQYADHISILASPNITQLRANSLSMCSPAELALQATQRGAFLDASVLRINTEM
jgi:hypothetical protein